MDDQQSFGGLGYTGWCSQHGYYMGNSCAMCAAKADAYALQQEPQAPQVIVITVPVPEVPAGYRLVKEETIQRVGEMIDELIGIYVDMFPEIDDNTTDLDALMKLFPAE